MTRINSTAESRFRVTHWPSTPLPDVDTIRRPVRLTASGLLDWTPPDVLEPLPDEWALQTLHGKNLGSDDVVVDLLGSGVISMPFFDRGSIPSDRWPFLAPPGDHPNVNRWWAERPDATVEDARWWLRTVRAMVGVWLISAQTPGPATPEDVVEAWTNEGFLVHDEESAWQQFTISLNEGLRPFRARAEHVMVFEGVEIAWGRPRTGLYSSACRQIFNLLANGDVPRWCENESCGLPFVKQSGRSKSGQHRSTGVRFCTSSCARAQTQREYRRRQKLKRNEGITP